MKEWIAQQLGQQLQVNPVIALVVVAGISVLFGFLGKMLWTGIVKLVERRRYGRWKIVVSGGKSGRNWHAPLETDLIRLLMRKKYFAFKRELGTIIGGAEGNLDFTFGVPVTDPLGSAPPVAPGLTIDVDTRTITVDYTKARR